MKLNFPLSLQRAMLVQLRPRWGNLHQARATCGDWYLMVGDFVHSMDQYWSISRTRHATKLKSAIRIKRRGLLSKDVALLHDNVHVHTFDTFKNLRSEMLEHPPYSPDLVPSYYHLFGPLKEALWGRRFASDKEVNGARVALRSTKNFFFLKEYKSLFTGGPNLSKSGNMSRKITYLSLLHIDVKKYYSQSADNCRLTLVLMLYLMQQQVTI